jgi:hypothetical protein
MAYIKQLLAFATCLLPALCGAQASLDGTWTVSFSTRDDETRQAVVTIAGAEGTWTTVAQPGKEKRDPCVGRPFPLTVVAAEPKRVVLEVAFAKQLAGCRDRTVTGEWVDATTVEGKLENGKPVRMLRK